MKTFSLLALIVFLAATGLSRDFTTTSGITYKDATVFDQSPSELVITFKDPADQKTTIMKAVHFKDLPAEVQKEFKYDPVRAEAYEKARAERIKELEAAKKKASAEAQKKKKEGGNFDGTVSLPAEGDFFPEKVNPVQDSGAPGEKDGNAEGKLMKREAGAVDRAPGEKEDLAEGRKMKRNAGATDRAPGEKEGNAEGNLMKREALGE